MAIVLMVLDALDTCPGRETAGCVALIRPIRRRNVACAVGDAEEGRRRGSAARSVNKFHINVKHSTVQCILDAATLSFTW